jgi:hypothetical protein
MLCCAQVKQAVREILPAGLTDPTKRIRAAVVCTMPCGA